MVSDDSSSSHGSFKNDDPSEEYYIHPNENPALVLTSALLNGVNYHSWARSMRMSLISKNKYRFVDGSIKEPKKEDSRFQAWVKCNNLVLSWLQRALNQEIAQSVIWIDNAYDLWQDLFDRFNQGDLVRVSDLLHEFYSLNQGNLSVTAYHTQLKALWDEISNFRPLPACNCLADSYRKQDFLLRLLRGLNDHFSVPKSQILMTKPFPSINEVFSILVQHERSVVSGSSDSSVFLADSGAVRTFHQSFSKQDRPDSTKKSFPNGNSKRPLCVFCGLYGHTVDKCYRKHGFPLGYRNRIQAERNMSGVAPGPVHNSTINALSSFVPVKDSGATDHIVNDIKFFESLSPVDKKYVRLPDNTLVKVVSVGTVKLSSSLVLHNAFFIPNFREIATWEMIGLARLVNGLYELEVFVPSSSFCNVIASSVVSVNTWHARLGHPSRQRMKCFSHMNKEILVMNFSDYEIFGVLFQSRACMVILTS
ncbi:hypothetical protein V6N11_077625 [Hibiscus sabdariffa]|uniref:Retrotransposon Copia-like N-terminal domain-containing protein n=1 Tax=Hibiscus sabdariffa TaxID=183260 RepID=A0ABR2TEI4_9ROSI